MKGIIKKILPLCAVTMTGVAAITVHSVLLAKDIYIGKAEGNIIDSYREELLVNASDGEELKEIIAMDDEAVYEQAKQNGDTDTQIAIYQLEVEKEDAKNLRTGAICAQSALTLALCGQILSKDKERE